MMDSCELLEESVRLAGSSPENQIALACELHPALLPDVASLVSIGISLSKVELLRLGERIRPSSLSIPQLADALNSGATLHIQNCQAYDEQVGRLARAVSLASGGWPVRANLYVSLPGSPPATVPHFDPSAIVVLQIVGTKRWFVWPKAASTEPSWHAVDLASHDFGREFWSGVDRQSFEITQGQVVKVARGVPHLAVPAGSGYSAHITFMVFKPSAGEFALEVLSSELSSHGEDLECADFRSLANDLSDRLLSAGQVQPNEAASKATSWVALGLTPRASSVLAALEPPSNWHDRAISGQLRALAVGNGFVQCDGLFCDVPATYTSALLALEEKKYSSPRDMIAALAFHIGSDAATEMVRLLVLMGAVALEP